MSTCFERLPGVSFASGRRSPAPLMNPSRTVHASRLRTGMAADPRQLRLVLAIHCFIVARIIKRSIDWHNCLQCQSVP